MAMQGDVRAGGWARRGRRLLLSLGVLTAGGFAVLFLTAGSSEGSHATAVTVAPSIGPGQAGVALNGAF